MSGGADATRRVAVVTGANKGIGFSIVKRLLQRFDGEVYLTARDEARGRAAVAALAAEGRAPRFHVLDVASRDSVRALRDHLEREHGGLDLLVNNAALGEPAALPYEGCRRIVEVNYYSLLTVQELLFPLLRAGARVLNISSDCGHLSNVRNPYWVERLSRKDLTVDDINEFVEWYLAARRDGTFDPADLADHGAPSYRVAKVAVSALTMVQQKELAARGVVVNSMHPGLVRTDMTADVGFLAPDEAADTPVYLLLDAPPDLRGAYVWYDRRVLDWYDHRADYYFKFDTLQGSWE